MITYKQGNLFDSDADCIFNTVNCEGYMGKGIAYQFKQRFPENNIQYEKECRAGKLRPGTLLIYREKGKTIVNFPTKDKWRNPSLMKYITEGLDEFARILPELGIKKAAIPPLGCGNGGLAWNDVKKEIENRLKACNIEIELFGPAEVNTGKQTQGQMTVYDLILLKVREELKRLTSLRFQKTFYFANYFYGSKMFAFSRGRYGPYSKDLYSEAERIGRYQKDNNLKGTKETYDAIYRLICSKRVDAQYKKMSDSIDKALEIVNATEDDLILEGAATAFYLIKDEKITEAKDITKAFKEWSDDKAARFNEETILHSIDKLEGLGMVQRTLFDTYEVM